MGEARKVVMLLLSQVGMGLFIHLFNKALLYTSVICLPSPRHQ